MLLTENERIYLYTKLHINKIPADIMNKIDLDGDFTIEDELKIKKIIKADMDEKGITFSDIFRNRE